MTSEWDAARGYVDRDAVVAHYNRWVSAMENTADFYEWFCAEFSRYAIPRDAAIADVGCGTGTLLRRLATQGYHNLTGVDLAPACLERTRDQVPWADLLLHDIEHEPLKERYDVILMTTVIDFLSDPSRTLRHARASLAPTGKLFVTVRNRHAYAPWYHLRHAERWLRALPRLRHWFLWLTTPLGLRRSDQPFERVYAAREMRSILKQSDFRVLEERGSQMLPMLWIPDLPRLVRLMRVLDRLVRRLPASPLCFRYLFVCEVPEPHGGNGESRAG